MVFDNLLVMLAGTTLGVISGLIPGVGTVVTLLISYPFIQNFDLLQTLVFYLAIVSASQFTGSVVSTTMGIPGDSSSLPAVAEGHALFKRGLGPFAISNAAIGSIVGSLIALLVVYAFLPTGMFLIKSFYNNNIQLAILLISSLIIIFAFENRRQNIFLFAFGFILATVGMSTVPLMLMWDGIVPYKTFPALYQGLPMFPVIIALFVLPTIAKSWTTTSTPYTHTKLSTTVISFKTHLTEYFKNITSSIRGSLIGSISGLVPHLTTDLASNLSYVIERKIGMVKKTYHPNGDIKSLVAAETANNSASFVQLVPLLMLGIPITTSESILLMVIENNSFLVNHTTTIDSGLFNELVLWFVCINILAFIFAWPLAKHLHYIFKLSYQHMMILIGGVLVGLMWYIGHRDGNQWYYLSVFAALAPIGYLLRNTNTLIIILAFVLQDKLLAAIIRASIIWSS